MNEQELINEFKDKFDYLWMQEICEDVYADKPIWNFIESVIIKAYKEGKANAENNITT